MTRVLKAASLGVALLFALGVVLATGQLFFFGSSKIRPLFGLDADQLARGDVDGGLDAGSRY